MTSPIALPDHPSNEEADSPAPPSSPARPSLAELLVAAGAFLAFCVLVLTKATALLEPDDSAYLASIVALSHGELLLSNAQYHALASELARHGGQGVQQWVQLSSGRWVSEKNPGYPFYAVAFQWMHALRLAPLFAGGLACGSLFVAARRWLGRWGGTYAVLLFLGSGAALSFAWRPTMSTFSDAAFTAVGASLVLWAMLATERGELVRTLSGLAGFAALELATSMRYTNVVALLVAVVAVLATYRRASLRLRSVLTWLASAVMAAAAILAFNLAVYGSATKTGYADGLITFAWSAIWPNLQHMPWPLLQAMPAAALAVVALGWMALRFLRRANPKADATRASRDLVVGLSLGAAWLGLWGLYLAYTWTVGGASHGPGPMGLLGSVGQHAAGGAVPHLPGAGQPGGMPGGGGAGGGIHVVRFYVPGLGLMALLGAWVLAQLPRWASAAALTGLALAAVLSFESLTAVGPLGRPGVPGVPGGGGTGGTVHDGGGHRGPPPAFGPDQGFPGGHHPSRGLRPDGDLGPPPGPPGGGVPGSTPR